jgi:hypothetical protein
VKNLNAKLRRKHNLHSDVRFLNLLILFNIFYNRKFNLNSQYEEYYLALKIRDNFEENLNLIFSHKILIDLLIEYL